MPCLGFLREGSRYAPHLWRWHGGCVLHVADVTALVCPGFGGCIRHLNCHRVLFSQALHVGLRVLQKGDEGLIRGDCHIIAVVVASAQRCDSKALG